MIAVPVRRLAAAAIIAVLVGACGGISLGDLDQFALNWKVKVTNRAVGGIAAVTLQIHDQTRSATLKPGESLEVIALKGGVWHLTVLGTQQRKDVLRSVYVGLVRELDALAPDDQLHEIVASEVASLEKGIASVTGAAANATCAGKADDPGGDLVKLGVAVDFNVGGGNEGNWYCFPSA